MKNQQERLTMPTRQQIANWWSNTSEGMARILDIKERLGIDLSGSLGGIEIDAPHCWACDKSIRGGRKRYNTRDIGLHRCHVIPSVHGGSNHPSNIVLMCTDCHKDNPDSRDEFGFWWWFSNVESHLNKSIRRLSVAIPQDMKDMSEETARDLHDRVLDILNEDKPVVVSGQISMGSMVSVLAKAVRQQRQEGRKFKLEQY